MPRLVVLIGGAMIVAVVVVVGWFVVLRQPTFGYPSPRFPAYLREPQSVDDMMPAARLAVRQTGGRTPLGLVHSGQRPFVLLPDDQDMRLWEAIERAWRERGVEPEIKFSYEVRGLTPAQLEDERSSRAAFRVTGGEGWKEIGTFRREIAQFLPEDVQRAVVPPPALGVTDHVGVRALLDANPDRYDAVFAGGGGRGTWNTALGPHAPRYFGNWTYAGYTDLLSKVPEFPGDLWKLAEDKVMDPVPFISDVRATDPEGTDLRFAITPENARIWREQMYIQGHIFLMPRPPAFTDISGTVAGCSNHTAYFPCMTTYVENSQITRLEGGGKFGDLARLLLDKPELKNARYPSMPYPGYWYIFEMAMGTSPKYFRPIIPLADGGPSLVNGFERNRAGVIHFGFGHESSEDADIAYARANNVPDRHAWHIHNYFITYEAQLRDTGERILMLDRGHMKAFDDPEVRALAARYGDPDLILRYEWIPALPGINVPGDYVHDYAPDPWGFISQEIDEIRKGAYRFLQADYPTPKGLEVGGDAGQ